MREPARVLVVDDEPDLLNLSAHLLKRAGYQVEGASSGAEAWRMVQEFQPDLVLLDVMLPDIDGIEICKRIKRDPRLSGIPVLILSALQTSSMSQAEGLEASADGYMTRPLSNREFLARVESTLRSRRAWAAPIQEQEEPDCDGAAYDPAKGLRCLLDLSRLVEEPSISLHEILQRTAELLPPAWQHPESASARIVLDDQEFTTSNYDPLAPLRQSADLFVHGQPLGVVQVCYPEGKLENTTDPFTNTERALLNGVAERLGRIVERTQAQEELRWNKVILSTIADPISFVDSTYVYRSVNEAYARYAKRPRQEIIGRPVAELLGAEAFQAHVKPHLDRCFAGQKIQYQAWFDVPGETPKCMDVGYYPVYDDQQQIVGAVVNSRDITDLTHAEEALRRERDLVTRIMETSPVGIVVLDREGQITFSNAQVERVTGLNKEQIAQRPYNDPAWRMIDGEGQPLADDQLPFPQMIGSGEPIHDMRQEVKLPDGQKLLLSMNAAPLLDGEGQPDGVVITVEDVTEQVQMHEQIQQHAVELEQRIAERTAELEASQMALLQAERLAATGKLAASLTHEISNPMQSVIGCLGLAQEAHDEGQNTGEYLDVALTELRRVARIVARLRNLGHPPSVLTIKEPTDIHALLDHVIALSRKKCQEQGIEIDLHVDEPLPMPLLAPDQIEQVLLNLAINAIDAMPEGGQLSIRASLTGDAGKQAGLEIVFMDTGAGIPADVLPHIFDPFFSTKPENLGLGLPICHDIVQQHDGRISVESQPGEGSRFTIWLPF